MPTFTKLHEPIKTVQGQSIADGPDEDAKPLTYSVAIVEALMTTESNITGRQAIERHDLASKINIATDGVELATSELATIQACAELRWGKAPVVLGPLFKLLEATE